jgi:hypothetical protein
MDAKKWEIVGRIWPIGLAVAAGVLLLVRWYDRVNDHVATEEPRVESIAKDLTSIQQIADDVAGAIETNARIDAKQEQQLGQIMKQRMLESERIKILCAMPNSGMPKAYCKNQEVTDVSADHD